MDVLGDVIARERRSSAPALSAPATGRRYDYRRFCTSAWKTGNFLRHLGVRRGVGVALADDPTPETVLALYGAAALGGVVTFGPDPEIDAETRALIVPAAAAGDFETGPTTKRVVYGDPPNDPSTSYFERDVWSENPTEPPNRVDPDDPLLRAGDERYSHTEGLKNALAIVDRYEIGPEHVVAVRGSFSDPAVVVAGVMVAVGNAGTFPGRTLGVDHIVLVVGGAFAVTLVPFVLFISYVLRILTVAKRTLAIEPLILRESQR